MGATIKNSLAGLFDELEKIGQSPGSLAQRAQLGAPGAWGGMQQQQQQAAGGAAGASTGGVAPPINPGDSGGAGMDMPKPPTAGEMGGGASAADLGMPGAGNAMKVSTQPPTPMSGTGTPPPGAPQSGSLLSAQRQKAPGTGSLSSSESAEVAPPSAAEFGG